MVVLLVLLILVLVDLVLLVLVLVLDLVQSGSFFKAKAPISRILTSRRHNGPGPTDEHWWLPATSSGRPPMEP